jgi:hypothetical protein
MKSPDPTSSLHRRDVLVFFSGMIIGGVLISIMLFSLFLNGVRQLTILPTSAPFPITAYTSTPFPTCNETAPPPIDGLQVWMLERSPAPGAENMVCTLLYLKGQPVYGVGGIVHFRYQTQEGFERSTDLEISSGGSAYGGIRLVMQCPARWSLWRCKFLMMERYMRRVPNILSCHTILLHRSK